MTLLAVETSTPWGSVAVRGPGGTLAERLMDHGRPHSETLIPAVEDALAGAGCRKEDVRALAVGTGPGAFTGLRVGLSTVKGWSAAADLPIVPVSSIAAAALPGLERGGEVAVLADARKGEVYAARLTGLDGHGLPVREGDILLLPYNRVPEWLESFRSGDLLVTGTGVGPMRSSGKVSGIPGTEPDMDPVPRASRRLILAERCLRLGRTVSASGLAPEYVRPPDAVPRGGPVPGG